MTMPDVVLRLALALPFGLVFGSFLTVAIDRIPAGESLVRPRSRCPSCRAQIRAGDNIPVVSWLVLRGRCRACRATISAVYPFTELGCGLLFVAVALVYEDLWQASLLAPFLGLLLAISVIDVRHHKIPNRLVYPAVLLSAGFVVLGDLVGGHFQAALAAAGFLAYGLALMIIALVAPRGMGMGDVKLAGLIGLVLGGVQLGLVGVAAGVGILLGGVGAVGAIFLGANRKTRIPFGPFMAGGAATAVFVGDQIADAYLRLLT